MLHKLEDNILKEIRLSTSRKKQNYTYELQENRQVDVK